MNTAFDYVFQCVLNVTATESWPVSMHTQKKNSILSQYMKCGASPLAFNLLAFRAMFFPRVLI